MKTLIAALVTLILTSVTAQAETFQIGKALLTTNGSSVTYVSQNSAKGQALLSKITPTIISAETLSTAAKGTTTGSKLIPGIGWVVAAGAEVYLYTKEDGVVYWIINSEDHLSDLYSVYNSVINTASSASTVAYNWTTNQF